MSRMTHTAMQKVASFVFYLLKVTKPFKNIKAHLEGCNLNLPFQPSNPLCVSQWLSTSLRPTEERSNLHFGNAAGQMMRRLITTCGTWRSSSRRCARACIVGCTILHSAFIIGDADVGFRRAKGLRNATNSV